MEVEGTEAAVHRHGQGVTGSYTGGAEWSMICALSPGWAPLDGPRRCVWLHLRPVQKRPEWQR